MDGRDGGCTPAGRRTARSEAVRLIDQIPDEDAQGSGEVQKPETGRRITLRTAGARGEEAAQQYNPLTRTPG